MNELQKKMAEIDGYEHRMQNVVQIWVDKTGKRVDELPTYNNRENILRVVGLLDDDTFTVYCDVLTPICATHDNWANQSFEWNQMQAFKATAEQMKEALAVALGIEPKEEG